MQWSYVFLALIHRYTIYDYSCILQLCCQAALQFWHGRMSISYNLIRMNLLIGALTLIMHYGLVDISFLDRLQTSSLIWAYMYISHNVSKQYWSPREFFSMASYRQLLTSLDIISYDLARSQTLIIRYWNVRSIESSKHRFRASDILTIKRNMW